MVESIFGFFVGFILVIVYDLFWLLCMIYFGCSISFILVIV